MSCKILSLFPSNFNHSSLCIQHAILSLTRPYKRISHHQTREKVPNYKQMTCASNKKKTLQCNKYNESKMYKTSTNHLFMKILTNYINHISFRNKMGVKILFHSIQVLSSQINKKLSKPISSNKSELG